MGSVTCPECGFDENEAFFKFCLECGADLSEPAARPGAGERAAEPATSEAAAVPAEHDPSLEAPASNPLRAEAAAAAPESAEAATASAPVGDAAGGGAVSQEAVVAAEAAEGAPAGTAGVPSAAERLGRDAGAAAGAGAATPQDVTPKTPPVTCRTCGSQVEAGFRFCAVCGSPLASVEEAQPSAPAEGEQQVAARPVVGRLVVIRPDQTEGRSFVLYEGTTSVGRRGADIAFPEDPFLEDVHLTFEVGGGRAVLRPCPTRNGVFVRIEEAVEVADGTELRIGQHLLQIEIFDRGAAAVRGPAGEIAMGAPWPDGLWGRLCVVAAGGRVARAWLLLQEEVHIGRKRGDILLSDDPFVSGRHAVLRRTSSGAVLEDAGSRNGTYVRVHDPIAVRTGNVLLAGQQLFRVQLEA